MGKARDLIFNEVEIDVVRLNMRKAIYLDSTFPRNASYK